MRRWAEDTGSFSGVKPVTIYYADPDAKSEQTYLLAQEIAALARSADVRQIALLAPIE